MLETESRVNRSPMVNTILQVLHPYRCGLFLSNLWKSGLVAAEEMPTGAEGLTDEQWAAVIHDCVVAWIDDEKLTPWQIHALLSNQTEFFVGRYKLLDVIANGGMGSVFKAEHLGVKRVVALKVMTEKLTADARAVARFRREMELACSLSHPNLVGALDADEIDGRYYLAMEHVVGRDLHRWVDFHGPLPLDFACECIRQACVGMQYAFEHGMVHRDLKPANLMATWTGDGGHPQIKILDLGLAKFVYHGSRPRLTTTGEFFGTPDFVAPEQAIDAKKVDIRADIFSLGCSLFWLLTSQLPYEGDSAMETVMVRLLRDPKQLKEVMPSAPEELNAVVRRMMARRPEDRYATPIEAAAALEPLIGSFRSTQRHLLAAKHEPRLELADQTNRETPATLAPFRAVVRAAAPVCAAG